MGQSSSNNHELVDYSNFEKFTIKIDQFKVEHPNYAELHEQFRDRFSLKAWNQAIWAIDESVKSFRNNITYISWKSAYHNINALKICAMVISTIPFCVSLASFLICIFLLIWSIFLTATGTDNSFYIWKSTYQLLSPMQKMIIYGSYIITIIGLIILYFTYKTLKPLKKQYAQTMARHISSNLSILNQIYSKRIKFQMEWIRINKSLMECQCYGEYNIPLIAYITIKILNVNINNILPMDDLIVMDAFMITANAESDHSSQSDLYSDDYNNLMRIRTKSSNKSEYDYCAVSSAIEGKSDWGDVQTDISIEISVADLNGL